MYLKYFLFSLLKIFFLESDLIFLKACVLYFNFFFYICRSFGTNLITPQCTLSLLYTTTYEWIHPFVFIYFLYLSLSLYLYIYLFILIFIHQYLFFYTNFIEVLDVCCIVSAMTAQFPSRINKVSDSDSCLFLFYILFCFKFVHFFYCLFKLLLNSLFYFIIVYFVQSLGIFVQADRSCRITEFFGTYFSVTPQRSHARPARARRRGALSL